MKELLYLEIPSPQTDFVREWLQTQWQVQVGTTMNTPSGVRLQFSSAGASPAPELSIFVWSVQNTTYLKVFRWANQPVPQESSVLKSLKTQIREQFPHQYPQLPTIDLSQHSIFEALAPYYPKTAHYFQRIPNGEFDLKRVYWWEQRWREGVQNPQHPRQVVCNDLNAPVSSQAVEYDLIYIGGALGVIHAAVMARLGYRVLLLERLPFGRMNREWNISRQEFQSLIDLGLFSTAEFEDLIACEYTDGFNKFFDANNPPQAKAPVLHTPTVLNIAIDAEKLLRDCGEKLKAVGGHIWDETEFSQVSICRDRAIVTAQHLPTQTSRQATGRLVVDAMGTASAISWQLNGGRAFDSVCPTAGAVIANGFEPGAWDPQYGDVLNSHGDVARGRQLIWELFPGEKNDLTFYLFHYHQVHPANPGSLLEMFEDFFTILPEYRRCDLDKLEWKKATFGYIPGYFSTNRRDRTTAFDRIMSIGDAASLQSPLVFTGFGSLVRNLGRLTDLLNTALQHDLLQAKHLNPIRSYQSNVAVTWLFSKGMMVPTGTAIAPQRINSMLNTFFGILTSESREEAEAFIKDRATWLSFNRMALKAARQNPALLWWIWELAGPRDLLRWLNSYWSFTLISVLGWLFGGWLPGVSAKLQPFLEPRFPAFWLMLKGWNYNLTYGAGYPRSPMPWQRFSGHVSMPVPTSRETVQSSAPNDSEISKTTVGQVR
jgi:lycopene cyclase CruA